MNHAPRGWFGLGSVSLVATSVAIVILAMQGHGPWTAVILGLVWGIVPSSWAIAAPSYFSPESVIRWRHRALEPHTNWRTPLEQWFSRSMAIEGGAPSESRRARSRVRRLGLALMMFWGVVVLVLLSASPFMDRL